MFMCSTHCTVGQIRGFCPIGILSNIFSNFSKIFFGAKKYFKQKVATQAKSQRGLKIIHRLVQSLWSLTQSYLVVHGGAWATKSSAQDGFWPDIALWTLWPTVQCTTKAEQKTHLYCIWIFVKVLHSTRCDSFIRMKSSKWCAFI